MMVSQTPTLKIHAVADGRVQGDVGLFDSEIGRRARRLGGQRIGVRAEQQIHLVTRSPTLRSVPVGFSRVSLTTFRLNPSALLDPPNAYGGVFASPVPAFHWAEVST